MADNFTTYLASELSSQFQFDTWNKVAKSGKTRMWLQVAENVGNAAQVIRKRELVREQRCGEAEPAASHIAN